MTDRKKVVPHALPEARNPSATEAATSRLFSPLRLGPVDGDIERHLVIHRRYCTGVFNTQGQGDLFVEDGKGGGVLDDQAAVPVLGLAGQKQMQGCGQVGGLIKVVQATV